MAEIQNISTQQRLNLNNSVVKKTLSFDFGLPQDYIELHIFNQSNQLLSSVSNFTNYTQPTPKEINMDPVQVLNTNGYLSGKYKLVFNIQRKKIFNTLSKIFTLKEISPSRTELRAIAGNINNSEFDNAVQGFINEIESSISFVDFILNFGQNQNIPGVNLILNQNPNKHEILIKLAQSLPNELSLNNNFNIITDISDSIIIDIDLGGIDFVDDSVNLKGPNFKIDVRLNNSVPSSYKNYDEILEYTLTSSYQNLLNQLEKKDIPNVVYDYIPPISSSDEAIIDKSAYHFENFVHFGSALERLKNFKYKIELLELYDSQLNDINSITGITSSSIYIKNNKEDIKTKQTNLIKGFDGYERFLYYNSGSFASWPKSNTTSPYTLYSISSSQVKTWIGDEKDSFPNYGGQLLSASLYDRQNKDNLINFIPNHIVENSDNSFYNTFVNMIGQHFDQTWLYIKHLTEVNNTDNLRGISKDLVYLSLKSLGLETFDQFENSNLIEYILGEGTTGSLFYDVPANQTLVTASNAGSVPKGDITREIWKRLYHNAPYLLKTKGTERGLRALMSCYGVPSTILNIKEFGGSTRDKTTYKTFSYEKSGLALNGDSGLNGYFIKTKWQSPYTNDISASAKTVEFRIKPFRSEENYHLFSLSGSKEISREPHLILEPYIGNDISSSGDSTQYGRLTFITNDGRAKKHTDYFPVYNGDFWNIFIGAEEVQNNPINLNEHKVKITFGAYQSNFLKTNTKVINFFDGLPFYFQANAWGLDNSFIRNNQGADIYTDGVTSFTQFGDTKAGARFCYIGGLPAGLKLNSYNYTPTNLRYSGSIQEIKYHYGELLSDDTLTKHALEPFMYSGNTPSSSYKNVVLRLPLGSNDLEDSSSFHPNQDINYLINSNLIEYSDFTKFSPDLVFTAGLYVHDTKVWFTSAKNFDPEPFIDGGGMRIQNNSAGEIAYIIYKWNGHLNTVELGRTYTLTYDIIESNHDSGLVIENNYGIGNTTLNTTVGTHTVEHVFNRTSSIAGENPFIIKRSGVSNLNVVINNLIFKEKITTSNMSTQKWEEVIETHHLPTPDTVGKSMTSEKVRIDEGTVDDDILLPNLKSETSTLDRQPLDYPDLGVYFSPTTEINEDILYTLGSFRLDDYIGSPLPSDQTSSIYNDLANIKDIYFKKVKNRYNYWDYIKLVQYIDHTLFKLIEQWVPMKANLKTGLVIEPHYLERKKIKRSLPTTGVDQSMLTNSYQTFEFEVEPNSLSNLSGSSVVSTNNLLQTTGSNQQRQEQGTNFTLDMEEYVTFEVGQSATDGNVMKNKLSNRYYQLRQIN